MQLAYNGATSYYIPRHCSRLCRYLKSLYLATSRGAGDPWQLDVDVHPMGVLWPIPRFPRSDLININCSTTWLNTDKWIQLLTLGPWIDAVIQAQLWDQSILVFTRLSALAAYKKPGLPSGQQPYS